MPNFWTEQKRTGFPDWVNGPTDCATRTFSTVLPKHESSPGSRHGAVKLVQSFPNRPMVKRRRIGKPGYYMGWLQDDECPFTGEKDCKARDCELHYMDAPLKLK